MSASSHDKDGQNPSRASGADARDARLKAALKANMARRKAQARARATSAERGPGHDSGKARGRQDDGAGQGAAASEDGNRHD